MNYVGNAFSFNMVPDASLSRYAVKAEPMTLEGAQKVLRRWDAGDGFTSVVGHQSTADLFTALLDRPIECAGRVSVQLGRGDYMVVGQYSGPRLEEGVTELPEGASIRWLLVYLVAVDPIAHL